MVAALPTFSDFRANSAATLPCTRSLWAVRRYPSKSGPRSAAVSFGAVLDGETVTMPAFHKIGAPGTASLLQLLPIAATTSWLEASLVAAVTPPSALQPGSGVHTDPSGRDKRFAATLTTPPPTAGLPGLPGLLGLPGLEDNGMTGLSLRRFHFADLETRKTWKTW